MRSASSIVGRRAELAQLHDALRSAADGRATTASVHVSHIIAKLGAANRVDAVAIARRRGLLPR